MKTNKKSPADRLLDRVEWLAGIFRYVAFTLVLAGVFMPVVFLWALGISLGSASWALFMFGILFFLGYKYCRYIVEQFELESAQEAEGNVNGEPEPECALCQGRSEVRQQLKHELNVDGYGAVRFCPGCGRNLNGPQKDAM